MENVSRMAEIYFRFSAESFVIRRPHTQYMTPVLQWLRQNLALPLRLRIDDLGNLNVSCIHESNLRLVAECIE